MQFLETSDTPRGALEHLQIHIYTDTHLYTDPNKTVLGFKRMTVWLYMETYRREEKTKTETTLHQKTRVNNRKSEEQEARRDKKNHRKTDRNSSKPMWPRSQQTLHNNTKQLPVYGKIFSGNTKVKDENGITSCIRKIKSRDGRNISVQYSMEKILKTQQILKWNNQQN